VLIVIGENPNKTYKVNGAQRKALIEKMLAGKVPDDKVEVQGMGILLLDTCVYSFASGLKSSTV
jgi:phosphopantetheine adenylyltransferase